MWKEKLRELQDQLYEANKTGDKETIKLLLKLISIAEAQQQFFLNYKVPKFPPPHSPTPTTTTSGCVGK